VTVERWKKVDELFHAAIELNPDLRNAFLVEQCGDDESLIKEVQSLISAAQKSTSFFDAVAKDGFTSILDKDIDIFASGEQIGAYKIIREIGRGGMGTVYLAERADEQFKKRVAIKVLKRGMDTADLLRHFRSERQILASFDHPNIARLFDGGSTSSGLPYFVMEFVEGKPINQYCDEHKLTINERLSLFQQVCAAASYAHRYLVIHRDIKPSNIVVTEEGVPKLLDFGIAKILQSEEQTATATAVRFMTPEFASPEQAQGLPVTTGSDVYSLGVVLYELLTGRSPYRFSSRNSAEIARTITETQPQLPSTVINTESENGVTPESISSSRESTIEKLSKSLRGDLDNIVLMALRKEPQRRYQSVEQFSEDIRRHLQGLPVLAQKDTWGYRTSKFVKRNKIAVASAAFAFLVVATALIVTKVIQSRADQQAKYMQEFGQEVARIESIMRYAYLLPLHDVNHEKQQVDERLKYIKERMQILGSRSHGPGNYALGRGYLALQRYQDAYNHLNIAWEKYQYREAPVANALGLSLAMLYQLKLQEAEQTYGKERVDERKKELEKQYRVPAIQFIQQRTASFESPEYIEALLTFLAKQYPEALKKAEISSTRVSWLYEAKILQGDVLTALANEERKKGNIDSAISLFEKAQNAYLNAAIKGQSDPKVYEGACGVQSAIHEMLIESKGIASEERVKEGIGYCEKALKADSTSINANLIASRIYRNVAFDQTHHGRDVSDAAEKAASYARNVLKIDPKNGYAHIALGNSYKMRADAEHFLQRDPMPFLELTITSLTQASAEMPSDHRLLADIASALFIRGEHEYFSGIDSRPTFDQAIGHLEKATRLDSSNARYHGMLGTSYLKKALYEHDNTNVDTRPSLRMGITFLEKSIELNPNLINSHYYLGSSYHSLAQGQVEYGENPLPMFSKSIQSYENALKLDPENGFTYGALGHVLYAKADYLQRKGEHPQLEINQARLNFQNQLKRNDKLLFYYSVYAEVELVAARAAIGSNSDPNPFFKEAHRILEAGLKLNPESHDCLESVASLHLLRAEYFSDRNQSPENDVKLGLQAAQHSLRIDPDNPAMYAYCGRFLLYRARPLSGSERQNMAVESVKAFEEAFKQKSFLKQEYSKYWEEAKQLANGSS
jgi:serine/threonine protein kinase